MTWYANNVYAKRSKTLESRLGREFPGSVYRVDDVQSHSWWKPEIAHGVPDGGLLAVRPISNGDHSDHLHEWYGEPVLSWNEFPRFDAGDRDLLIPPRILPEAEDSLDILPSEGFLQFLHRIAREFSTATLYYQCFMWGGDTEIEFAFVYSNGDEFLYSFAGFQDDKPQLEIRKNSSSPTTSSGDVLIHALDHIGLRLPSPYFAPHTRSFPWDRYRVTEQA